MFISWSPIMHGWLNASRHALGDLLGFKGRDIVADDHELVASETCNGVAWTDRGDEIVR